ncbi:hypothetical protein LTR27_005850 [Elasticomyces elasticus]|nr:hypothetical protein LTR27_005850 [Elasticomyces elasticus]
MEKAEYEQSGSTLDADTSARRPESFSTLTELVRTRATEVAAKDLPIISYPSFGISYVAFTPTQIDRLADKAASYYEAFIHRWTSSDEPVQVLALLGPSTFAYFITLLALSRLGHSVLLLSTRLPLAARVSLLQTTSYRLMDFFAANYGHALRSRSKVIRTEKLGHLLPAYKQIPVLVRDMVELQLRYQQLQWAHQSAAA